MSKKTANAANLTSTPELEQVTSVEPTPEPVLDQAWQAYVQAGQANDRARKAYDRARKAYDRARKAYDQAGQAYVQACRA